MAAVERGCASDILAMVDVSGYVAGKSFDHILEVLHSRLQLDVAQLRSLNFAAVQPRTSPYSDGAVKIKVEVIMAK